MDLDNISQIEKKIREGNLKDVLELSCPECGSSLEIEYSNDQWSSCSVLCSCMQFGIKMDGLSTPPWAREANNSQTNSICVRIENHKVVPCN